MQAEHLKGVADATSLYAEIVVELGEYLQGATLVLPDNEHFPDDVDASPTGVRILFERVLTYTPIPADLAFELHFHTPDDDEGGGGGSCGTGGCGPKAGAASPWMLTQGPLTADESDTWHLTVGVQDVRNPTRLMSQLARLAGDWLLAQALETKRSLAPFERAVRAETAAIACGLGPLLLAASHMESKGCGGVRVYEGTALPPPVLAALTVLFAEQHDEQHALRRAASLLSPTPREALEQFRAFFTKRPDFVQQLKNMPESVAFHCDFGPEQGLLKRLFGSKSSEAAPQLGVARLR